MTRDDNLRELFEKGLEPVDVPEGLGGRLAERTAEAIAAASGASSGLTLPAVIGIAAAGGLLVGGLLGIFSGAEAAQATTLAAAPIYACPGSDEVGTLHQGDRVVMIGQSGEWIAVRNVRGDLERVFISRDHVTADDTSVDLPEANCDENGKLVVAGEEVVTTTTTTLPPETTTTTAPQASGTTSSTTSTTSTTQPPTTTSTTTTQPPTTTTEPPDTTAPVVGQEFASPTLIWEQDGLGITCPAPTTRQATVGAVVTDNVGVADVTATWTDPLGSQSRTMAKSGDNYTATFGPYPAGTWDPANLAPFDHLVTITITARDAEDNTDTAAVQITVQEIGECFG